MRKILFIFLIASIHLTAFSQTESAGINPVISKLKTLSTDRITEKAYLHFDKSYYAAGDTIYFKAYVTLGERHEPSKLSGVLHVDLINTNNKIDQSLKLQLNNGIAWGDFALPDSLPMGNYRVRAYTQWMRNTGDKYFFDQIIPVGAIKNSNVLENINKRQSGNNKIDVQFFPEGGSLVTGVASKVAFKAIDINGRGIMVKGVISDNENKNIVNFVSNRFGMGCFSIKPQEGELYNATIIFGNGAQTKVELPIPDAKGIVLSVNNDSLPKATVKIMTNAVYYNEHKKKTYYLMIYSGGIATTATCNLDSQVINLDILKRHLFTGVATITLFSTTGEPLCERLIFVQNYHLLNVDISSGKVSYKKREKVNLLFNVKDRANSPSSGYFSVSIIDEGKVPVDEYKENTILTNLLLTSDLTGYIETPNYYFINSTEQTRCDLDVLMLTSGYRKFTWKQLLNESKPVKYQPEKSLQISGTVKTLFGKPVANGKVALIAQMGGPALSQVSNKEGEFCFSNLVFMDTTRFLLQAVTAKGKNLTQLTYYADTVSVEVSNQIKQEDNNAVPESYLRNTEKQQEQLNLLGLGKGKILKEVIIKGIKATKLKFNSIYGVADQVIRGDQILYGGQLATRLMGHLHGVQFVSSGNRFVPWLNRPSRGPMTIVVDGIEMPTDFDISSINTSSVETVEVMSNATVNQNGVLLITTSQGLQPKDISSTGILPIIAKGFYKAREFYAPKYDINPQNPRADLRTTIFWKPDVVTDKDGNASFEYYNADGQGTYRVVVEGIDDKGNIGRQVYRYKVD
ncbi:hypothetical protein BH09BAC6_BH09BAC6_01150 [soil metagenome]|jgi:hypothetical protein